MLLTLILGAIFLSEPVVLDRARAKAYLVTENAVQRHEDRFKTGDLWWRYSSLGLWRDAEGRFFELLSVGKKYPPFDEEKTNLGFLKSLVPLKRRDKEKRLSLMLSLLPSDCIPEPRRLSMLPASCEDFMYFESTNKSSIVTAFRLKGETDYIMSFYELVPGDSYPDKFAEFEKRFFKEELPTLSTLRPPPVEQKDEFEAAKAMVSHSVTNYSSWNTVFSGRYAIINNLERGNSYVAALMNEFQKAGREFAEVIPGSLDWTNVLYVARIFGEEEQYAAAVGAGYRWTRACWNQSRREILSYVSRDGQEGLIKTIRHEAFHQYLSYATAMIETSPWFNEGYARYFEDVSSVEWPDATTPELIEMYAEAVKAIFRYDYEMFYSGSDDERRFKYLLAWSIAAFIERGADKVRFRPFADLKKKYIDKLLERRDHREATAFAFGSEDNFNLFISEWVKYWKENL